MNIRFKKEQLIRSSRINSKRTCRLRALTHSLTHSVVATVFILHRPWERLPWDHDINIYAKRLEN